MENARELKAQGQADWDLRDWKPQTLSDWTESKGGMLNLLENEFMIKHADLSNKDVYTQHAQFLMVCANDILEKQGRRFIVDEHNRDVLKFLLYYFNGCDECEKVFPNKEYKLGKQLLLYGEPGTGKTLIMEMFSLYLRRMNNPYAFVNISLTQMMNHFQVNENIDRYTFNAGKDSIEGRPFNVCLNDIGVSTHRHYGTDPKVIIEEFLFSRNDIYVSTGQRAHLTTNMDKQDIRKMFGDDEHGRLMDRIFNTYNFIPLTGESRR